MCVNANCKRWLLQWLLLMAVLPGAVPLVFAASEELAQRFPPGSIASPEVAQRALDEVAGARTRIEAAYEEEQRRCHGTFFVNRCLSDARESRRIGLEPLTPIEVEANRFLRQRKVEARDAGLARKAEEKEARRQQDAPTPSDEPADILDQRERSERTVSGSEAAPAKAAGKSEREIKHEESVRRHAAEEEAMAEKRAQKTAAFERKQQEAEERREKTARRKAEKERQRQEGTAVPENPLK